MKREVYTFMWFGLVMTEEEIKCAREKVYNRFHGDRRKTIPRVELVKALEDEFKIPNNIAEAYVTLALTYYSTDWYAVLDNVICLMETKLRRSVYECIECVGVEPTVENAKKEIAEITKRIESRNN